MDPLTKAYLKIITESEDLQKGQKVEGETSQTGKVFGNAESEKNKALQKKTGPECADDCETPEEAPAHLTQSAETNGKPEKNSVSYENKNPFDALYNKILSEEGEEMSFSTGATPEDSSFGIAEPFGGESSDEESDEFGEEGAGEEDEVTFSLPRELAERLHEVLGSVLSEGEEGEEGEEHEGEESEGEEEAEHAFGGSEEGEEENPFKEATDMQALAGAEGLSLTDKSKKEVKGAVPVTKKSAQTPSTGKGHDGVAKAFSTETGTSKLTSKAGIKVGSVDKIEKSLFEQD
jgi:hypothetical protein